MPLKLNQAAARKLGLTRSRKRTTTTAPCVNHTFLALCKAHGLPEPTSEYQFALGRHWRFDWAWIDEEVALEIDGGAWTGGRHTRGKGFIADQEKRNTAVILGWRVLHCTPQDVESGKVFGLLKEVLG